MEKPCKMYYIHTLNAHKLVKSSNGMKNVKKICKLINSTYGITLKYWDIDLFEFIITRIVLKKYYYHS